jgi:hypothetical protein
MLYGVELFNTVTIYVTLVGTRFAILLYMQIFELSHFETLARFLHWFSSSWSALAYIAKFWYRSMVGLLERHRAMPIFYSQADRLILVRLSSIR